MQIISDIFWILSEILTFGGVQRLADARKEYNSSYDKHKLLWDELSDMVKENNNRLELIGKRMKSTLPLIKSARRVLQVSTDISEKGGQPSYGNSIQALERIDKLNDKYSSVGYAGLGAASGSALAIGSWTLVSIAGAASTGTAISTLSGAAATNAALAWFGGGALAAGGAGMAGGMLMLGGIVLFPLLIIWGYTIHRKAKKLESATETLNASLLRMPDELEKLRDIKTKIESHYEEICKSCDEIAKSIADVDKLLYESGWFSYARRKIRKALGGEYYQPEEQSVVEQLSCEVNNFLSRIIK